jgi:hypothetical protein
MSLASGRRSERTRTVRVPWSPAENSGSPKAAENSGPPIVSRRASLSASACSSVKSSGVSRTDRRRSLHSSVLVNRIDTTVEEKPLLRQKPRQTGTTVEPQVSETPPVMSAKETPVVMLEPEELVSSHERPNEMPAVPGTRETSPAIAKETPSASATVVPEPTLMLPAITKENPIVTTDPEERSLLCPEPSNTPSDGPLALDAVRRSKRIRTAKEPWSPSKAAENRGPFIVSRRASLSGGARRSAVKSSGGRRVRSVDRRRSLHSSVLINRVVVTQELEPVSCPEPEEMTSLPHSSEAPPVTKETSTVMLEPEEAHDRSHEMLVASQARGTSPATETLPVAVLDTAVVQQKSEMAVLPNETPIVTTIMSEGQPRRECRNEPPFASETTAPPSSPQLVLANEVPIAPMVSTPHISKRVLKNSTVGSRKKGKFSSNPPVFAVDSHPPLADPLTIQNQQSTDPVAIQQDESPTQVAFAPITKERVLETCEALWGVQFVEKVRQKVSFSQPVRLRGKPLHLNLITSACPFESRASLRVS